MKLTRILVIALAMCLIVGSFAHAQKKMVTDTSYLDRTQKYIVWMKDTIKKMNEQLDEARKEQDLKKIECIEKRLTDIQKLYTDIQSSYKQMRDHSFNKRIAALQQEFTVVDQKRKIVEQLVRLVNDCMGRAFYDGFTESVEEFFGIYEDGDPTYVDVGGFWPDPLPPIYEPRPASLAENE